MSPSRAGQQEDILKQLQKIVYSYGLNHVTLQVELSTADCEENHHEEHEQARMQAQI